MTQNYSEIGLDFGKPKNSKLLIIVTHSETEIKINRGFLFNINTVSIFSFSIYEF